MAPAFTRPWSLGLSGFIGLALATVSMNVVLGQDDDPDRPDESELPRASELDYQATIDVVPRDDEGDDPDTVTGVVFDDTEMDGVYDSDTDSGVPGVMVSNGREVVETDEEGAYELPAYDDMDVFVTKPASWATPVDEDNIPQTSYTHKPEGSSGELRFGGLEPTGPLPEAINFPMVPVQSSDEFDCVISGDTQTYSSTEVGYMRDSFVDDLVARDLSDTECLIVLGDVMGDDLGLLPRYKDVMSSVGLPQYLVYGNHDIDLDATDPSGAGDTWRREYGPTYYSFDIGQVHFIALDSVIYPCGEDDAAAGRDHCGDPDSPDYNGRIDDIQMEWLANDLAHVPEDELVVLSHHIPLVSAQYNASVRNQIDNANEVYELLEGRKAVSFSAHTHTLEQLLPGETYAGWEEAVGVTELPFHHIIAGAEAGSWYSGDLDWDGVPMSIGSQGEPRGYLMTDFAGTDYRERFYATGHPNERQMWLSFNTPQFREWFETLRAWTADNPPTADGVPPVNINDLADTKLFTPEDLAEGVFLTANVWNGSRDTDVSVSLDGGDPLELARTQSGQGEELHVGVDYADPFSVVRQMQTARYAFESESGNERAQGWEQTRGSKGGPGAPQSVSERYIAEKSSHLWRVQMPEDLEIGTHTAEVTSTDRYGRTVTDQIVFEVRAERPDPFWRAELWD